MCGSAGARFSPPKREQLGGQAGFEQALAIGGAHVNLDRNPEQHTDPGFRPDF